jgi:hypothetical protein
MDNAKAKQINETTPKVRDNVIIRLLLLSTTPLGLVSFEVGGEIMAIVEEGIFNRVTDTVEESF